MSHKLLGTAILVSTVLGALLLASCATTPTTPSEKSTTTTNPYGSLVVQGSFGTNPEFDPPISAPAGHRLIASAFLDSLTHMSPDGEIVPGIAERWEISPDGLAHTFFIRKGVKFHDGNDLTGADVKFSIERFLAPDAINSDAPAWRSQVTKVELKNEYAVVLSLKQAQFQLLPGFDLAGGATAVVPKKYIEEKGVDYFRKNPIGSGPFKVVNNQPGTRIELEAVEVHWRGVPKFRTITKLNVPEEATKVAMLKTGELDIAEVSPDSVPGLKAAGLRIVNWDNGGTTGVWLFYDVANPTKYTLGDIRVRKALSLAIDRKEMADKLFAGYARPGVLWFVSRHAYFYDPNVLKPDPYDPEGAKKLLAEAGYPNGFSMKNWDATDVAASLSMINLAVAGYWRKIGVNLEMVPITSTAFRSLYSPKQSPDIWNSSRGAADGGSTGFERMEFAYHATKGTLKNNANSRLSELIDQVPLTRDPVEKKRLALDAAVMAKNEYSIIGTVGLDAVVAVGAKVGELTVVKPFAFIPANYEMITHAK